MKVLVDIRKDIVGDQTAGVKHFVFIGGNVCRDGIVRVPRFDQFIAPLRTLRPRKSPLTIAGVGRFSSRGFGRD